jgi:hypothetical protein
VTTTNTVIWTRRSVWMFTRHYLEMVAAMIVGMIALGPLEHLLLDPIGWQALLARPELDVMVMATNMTVAMAAWMRLRHRHGWPATVEMSVAMYLPFLVLFPPMWLGLLGPHTMMDLGHLLMLPAMVGAMFLRPHEYTGHHHEAAQS